ncbi:CCA tRNA nucleotidyltransferase [Sphingomonas sp. HDW15A]|uniref:CCA tRNA nucleotidyltransferase n=1 Tax=Sphingomonas sp. HDW15A TaxID=2714942 RepID=UPI00140DCAAE|nr:CCA tRNA nucleotidyltransferase [Sphingomonas sp. HDW15A]QIK96315.1 CCA tRNA nucleotidyltransferase [Sphingomonas sp. HDW15A]
MKLDAQAWRKRRGIARILTALDSASGHVRYVGGAVRDDLLGLPISDIDLATSFHPDDVVRRLEKARIKAVPTGIAHGTITAVADGQPVEITTLRSDVSTDGRRATVAFSDDWPADAARRDFTINALYADPETGEISDYFGGLDDLEARRVRFIGDPLTRIAEDHLRILRFFRFHARFGFGEPDSEGLAACTARANDLMALSRERIADELIKILGIEDPTPTVALMIERGILKPVIPEIVSAASLAKLVASEKDSGIEPDALRRLAALLPRDPVIAADVAARLKLSNKARKRLAAAAAGELGENPRSLAYWIGQESAIDRLLLAARSEEAHGLAAWTVPRLPISGGQLIKRGVTEGPLVARTLKAIERAWVTEGFPDGEKWESIVSEQVGSAKGG